MAITNCAMGSHFVVLGAPFFDLFSGVVQIEEPVLAEPADDARESASLDRSLSAKTGRSRAISMAIE